MILPGVPRAERVNFVKVLLKTLFESGLQEVTEEELQDFSSTVDSLMDSIEPCEQDGVSEEESSGGC